MRYVLATDGSEQSLKAARFLVQHFCPGSDDEVFVVYVFPVPSDPACYSEFVVLPSHADDERVLRVARPILDRTLQLLTRSGGDVKEVVLVGNPAKEIVEFAMNLHVNLIAAGTHGHSPEKELYLGSVSSALTHRARCSVLIVR